MTPIFFKRAYFRPDDYQKTVFDVDYDHLRKIGIDVLFIDVDNTLVSYDETIPGSRTLELLDGLKKSGFRVILISNNHEPRVRTFADACGLPFVHGAKKPFRCGFRRAEALAGGPDPSRVAVLGDQFMTDVYGGKRMGYRVVVVDAIKRKTEKWYTKVNRRIERLALADLHRSDPDFYDGL
ncbi:MAG: YqeG family HAD IIIA-type phosphatase, partial [Bacillota bacterium]|nr:YqeG family HAD IIIA-type phosphatase [Bacillota bacterium]